MEVFTDLQLLVNITARSPRLVARGLPPGQVLFLRVYASNTKGRSRSVRIDGYTLRMADKRPGKIACLAFLQGKSFGWAYMYYINHYSALEANHS